MLHARQMLPPPKMAGVTCRVLHARRARAEPGGGRVQAGHLLEAGLLAHRDAVEDLATAAIKEEAIEAKLGAIAAEWGEAALTFQDYKTRGAVVLKARLPPCPFLGFERPHPSLHGAALVPSHVEWYAGV